MSSPPLQRSNGNLLFQPETAMARGVLVVDSQPELIPMLEAKNFKVF
jgi:hypothetical protein